MDQKNNQKNKFAILAIGTEVTSGQIVNRNSAWLSENMERLGFESVVHMSVPDDRQLMLKGLALCSEMAEIVFTTGGLGPTTDDFTRDVVGEFFGLPMEFDGASLEKIENKMKSMGRPRLESQKQQCFYPRGSKVLNNSAGTANGFLILNKGVQFFILPGPPGEVEAIWTEEIEKLLQGFGQKKSVLIRWNCMGKPEAEFAEKVETAVKGSKLLTGYRLNAPYVEIKLWCAVGDLESQRHFIEKAEDELREWIVLRDDEDPWARFIENIRVFQYVTIVDEGSDGLLSSRLASLFRSDKNRDRLPKLLLFTSFGEAFPRDPSTNFTLRLSPIGVSGQFTIELETKSDQKIIIKRSPSVHSLQNERSRLAAAEIAILEANQFLTTET